MTKEQYKQHLVSVYGKECADGMIAELWGNGEYVPWPRRNTCTYKQAQVVCLIVPEEDV